MNQPANQSSENVRKVRDNAEWAERGERYGDAHRSKYAVNAFREKRDTDFHKVTE